MIDSQQIKDEENFRPFEGVWLLRKPSGAVACAKVVQGHLLIPFAFAGKEKVGGHCYDCQIVEGRLLCRFEHFDSAISGVMQLSLGPNSTLVGNRCVNDQTSKTSEIDLAGILESCPDKEKAVWIRILEKEVPAWAQKYFTEDWPNKNKA